MVHVRDSDPARPGNDIPAFNHGWATREQAEEERRTVADRGDFAFNQMSVKSYGIIPEDINERD
jgi:hypothetical protein